MSSLPATFRKLQAVRLSSDFRNATQIVECSVQDALQPSSLPDKSLLLQNIYLGVNASDVNFTAGKYLPGVQPPFDVGFEGVAKVVSVGKSLGSQFKQGDFVVYSTFGAFAEYLVVGASNCFKVQSANPEFLPLFVSGLTASLALEQTGELVLPGFDNDVPSRAGRTKQLTVLITAAAGATGLFALQLAVLAGHRVIGTTSSDRKIEFLKREIPGIHRIINHKTENLNSVLKNEYPDGIDVVYESVGGATFDVCVNNLAVGGKLIIIGAISGYQDGSAWNASSNSGQPQKPVTPLPSKLLARSASIRGFFLNHFAAHRKRHIAALVKLMSEGKLRSFVDEKRFEGFAGIADAIDYMYRGENIGKVVVELEHSRQHARL